MKIQADVPGGRGRAAGGRADGLAGWWSRVPRLLLLLVGACLLAGCTSGAQKRITAFSEATGAATSAVSDAFGAERTMIVDKTPMARLVITKGKQQGQEFKITQVETYIGRSADNDIRLHDWFVSKKHAMILRQGQNFFIKDLKSWRGTMVNGKFTRESPLKDSDTLQLGSTILTFHISSEEELLKITGRVPKEIEVDEVDEVDEYATPEEVLKEPVGVAEAEKPAESMDDIEEKIRHEEEEVAQMQAAWESIEEEIQAPVEHEEAGEEIPVQEETPAPEEAELEEAAEEAVEEPAQVEAEEPVQVEAEELVEAETEGEPFMEQMILDEAKKSGDYNEVDLWEKALKNPSKIIRKNAAMFLKKLTGKDYDYD